MNGLDYWKAFIDGVLDTIINCDVLQPYEEQDVQIVVKEYKEELFKVRVFYNVCLINEDEYKTDCQELYFFYSESKRKVIKEIYDAIEIISLLEHPHEVEAEDTRGEDKYEFERDLSY